MVAMAINHGLARGRHSSMLTVVSLGLLFIEL